MAIVIRNGSERKAKILQYRLKTPLLRKSCGPELFWKGKSFV